MRKRIKTKKLGRPKNQRQALLKGLAANLFIKEKLKTTEGKAKALRPVAEKLITKAKKGGLPARRRLGRFLPDRVAKKLIENIAPRYKTRPGGYTRIIKLVPRQSDSAKMAIIELV